VRGLLEKGAEAAQRYLPRLLSPRLYDRVDREVRAAGPVSVLFVRTENGPQFLAAATGLLALSLVLALGGALQGFPSALAAPAGAALLAAGAYKKAVDSYKREILSEAELPALFETLAAATDAGITLREALRHFAKTRSGLVSAHHAEALLRIDAGEDPDFAIEEAARRSLNPRFLTLARLITQAKRSREGLKTLFSEQAEEIFAEVRAVRAARAEKLETKLFFPVFACFFLPVVVLAALPFLASAAYLFR